MPKQTRKGCNICTNDACHHRFKGNYCSEYRPPQPFKANMVEIAILREVTQTGAVKNASMALSNWEINL